MGDIQGVAYPAGGLLDGIGTFVNGIVGVNPAGGNGVDPDLSAKLTARAWVRAAMPPLAAV